MLGFARQSWLVLVLLGIAVGLLSHASPALWQPLPITGIDVPGLSELDRLMARFMIQHHVVGGALAVAKDGRLIYARGFGFSDKETNQSVQPDSLFRIASVSKPITAVAALKLYEEGKLDLNAKAFSLLSDLQPPPGASPDPRLQEITVRQLLQHASGLVRSGFGASRENIEAAHALGVTPPASSETIVRYGLTRPLDFAPGTRAGYSTLGYVALGRVLERVQERKYEEYVKQRVLAPAGVSRMQIGETLPHERISGEVRYYDAPGAPLAPSVYPPHSLLPRPYVFYLKGVESGGGWIASSIDLLRFVTTIDGQRPPALLKPETVALMTARPDRPDAVNAPVYFGMGWVIRQTNLGVEWQHNGSLIGARSLLVRRADGVAWAVLFNAEPSSDSMLAELDREISQILDRVKEWPTHDLFSQYP
ncbi:MAG: beta-lactamase family protein [Candidatus Bipolaricaulota bacterium]|nr:beta-lactamase family protein [Candidatus Bipolaricaulota bacterium]MDW8140877.1 serine hydrolase domain-containing protein [Candidatus Bipolaricaulota bacterium]